MRSSEWPLILFTLLIQMSVGFIIALCFFQNSIFAKNGSLMPRETPGKLVLMVVPLLLIALLASLFHLGTPRNAWYVLSNVADSWLSREILLTIIFSVLVFSVSVLNYKGIFSPQLRFILLLVCALCGVILLFTMSRLYMLETVPAWNGFPTPGAFFLTALNLGFFFFLTSAIYLSGQSEKNILSAGGINAIYKTLLFIGIALLLIELAMWLLHLKFLSAGAAASRESFNTVVSVNAPLFIIRIVLSIAAAAVMAYTLYSSGRNVFNVNFIYISFVLIIFVELIGRYLFYAMYARIGV
ncbi:MAG: dimethyl sulfoxide reductase anchor subunit family protein [Ignavibacteriales bacterium]